MQSPLLDFWATVVGAYLEKDQQVAFGDGTAICLGVTSEMADSDRDPVAGAKPEVQHLTAP